MIRKFVVRLLMFLPFPIAFVSKGHSQNIPDSKKKEMVESKIASFEKDFTAPQISVIELQELLKKDAGKTLIVDVRTKKEQSVSMLQGAITSEEFSKNPDKYKGKTIVSYCTIGYRSSIFTEKLVKKGFKALNLRGSILMWAHYKGKLYTPSGNETNKVHVYSKDWSLLPASYTPEY